MKTIFLESILYILIIIPIVFFSLKDKKKETYVILTAFIVYFLLHNAILFLPIEFKYLQPFNSSWNWAGKIYSIFGSILFLCLYRKFELKDYFLTFKQDGIFLKKGILIIVIYITFEVVVMALLNYNNKWSLDTILFQLTMPGIDEEIAFRGIMLGLLTKVLSSKIEIFAKININPVILITAILFGLSHSLFLSDSFEITFHYYPFFRTALIGYLYGWLTIKSGSILLALITHNLTNTFTTIVKMF